LSVSQGQSLPNTTTCECIINVYTCIKFEVDITSMTMMCYIKCVCNDL